MLIRCNDVNGGEGSKFYVEVGLMENVGKSKQLISATLGDIELDNLILICGGMVNKRARGGINYKHSC